jgi:hypothetical protein
MMADVELCRLSASLEQVLKDQPRLIWDGLIGEDIDADEQDVLDRVQAEAVHKKADVFRVAATGCLYLHRQQMFGRGGRNSKSEVVENALDGGISS